MPIRTSANNYEVSPWTLPVGLPIAFLWIAYVSGAFESNTNFNPATTKVEFEAVIKHDSIHPYKFGDDGFCYSFNDIRMWKYTLVNPNRFVLHFDHEECPCILNAGVATCCSDKFYPV